MPKTTNTNAPWAPFARTILRRLHESEDDSSFDLDIDMDGDAIAPRSKRTPPGVIELLDGMDSTQKHDPRDLAAMRAAGVDGVALDDRGSDRPPHTIATGKILMALRLAATFIREEHFLDALEPRAVTVLEGIVPAQLSGAATLIGRLLVPEGWTAHARAPRHMDSGVLQLLRPMDSGARKISEQAIAKIEQEILTALTLPHPLMILLPETALLPPELRRVLPPAKRLAPINRDLILKLLGRTHSATGKIDAALVRPHLPDNEVLTTLDMPSLMSALREPDASAVAHKLTALLAPSANTSSDMTLEEIGGDTPTHQAARDLVTDLAAWRRGEAQWTELSASLHLEGEPGSGKTLLARAIAASARVPLVEGSFGNWQSGGHLGDMLREMRRTFSQAASRRPCVLFVDEVDAAGSRESQDRHAESYRRQVVNQFLQEIDNLRRGEGVLLIGATNHKDALDPAILRPGRFDLHHSLGRPTQVQILHMLRRALPEATEPDLAMLARVFSGETPAMIDAAIRAAKAQARRSGQLLRIQTLIAARPPVLEGYDRRIAIHECGHAIVASLLGAGPVRRMQLSRDGGR
ncbi:ATP-binding protein [Roseicyclus sp. F158]|uniref:ATP-binding protein n=1 Tax=Tropicimonas omnivorans TaxID=3075590 RepID=A0ABU3DLE1_9RHOB|nr:ATP-binding protein [Roseicyclus sp. F158]MDT0684512.1 ATP-binding protein [Roseicyclus sp. F158]